MNQTIKNFLNNIIIPNKVYFIGYFVFILLLSLFFIEPHRDFLLEWFNQHRNPFLNYVFICATKIAEEQGIIIVFIILLLFRYSAFLLSAISISIATLISNVIKTITDLPRPLEVYDKIKDFSINFVPGVDVHRFMSFPSGHTTAAFAMLFFLLLISKNTFHRLSVLLLSIIVAISRVYLFQHFTRDVYVASLLGLLIALIISFIFIHFRWFNELEQKNGLMDTFIRLKQKKKSS